MSRNEDKTKGTEKRIKFNFNIQEGKSNDDLLEKNENVKEILHTKENSKEKIEIDKNQDIKEEEEEDKLKEIEEKCKLIYNDLPLYYSNIFEEEYIAFFQKGNNLDLFADIVDAIRNYDVDKNESPILKEFDKRIFEDILHYTFNKDAIRIYIDLYKFYNKFKGYNLLEEEFINEFEKEENLKYFDNIYRNIKINLFKKTGGTELFSEMFFINIDIKIIHFFVRIYMIRIFINFKNNEKKNFLSIINPNDHLNRILILKAIDEITFKKFCYNRLGDNELDEKKKFENHFFSFFEMLIDLIFFESSFRRDERKNNNNNKSIFEKYYGYYNELSVLNNNNYSCFYEPYYENDAVNSMNNKWNDYIKNEYSNQGLKIVFNSLNYLDDFYAPKKAIDNGKENKNNNNPLKYREKQHRKLFYDINFMILEKIIVPYKEVTSKEIIYIYAIIKLILYEGNRNNIFKIYEKSKGEEKENDNREKIFISIINKIIGNLEYINDLKENIKFEYLNSLILLLESFGEYKNNYLNNIMFKNKAQNDETLFQKLINIFKQFLTKNDENENTDYNDDIQKNKLILFNSLTNCIIEYMENSSINYEIFGNDEKDHEQYFQFLSYLFSNINYIHDNQNLYFHIFKLENYILYDSYLMKNMKVKNINYKEFMKISEGYIVRIFACLEPCFKKLLSMLNLSLSFDNNFNIIITDNDKQNLMHNNKKNFIFYYKIDDKINEDINDKIFFDYEIQNIKPSVNALIYKYKNYELISEEKITNKIIKELFLLIFLNYKYMFYLNELSDNELKYFLNINDNDINFNKSKNYLESNIYKKKEKFRIFILFSFLQEICDVIEIRNNEINSDDNSEIETKDVIKDINFLNPEYLTLPTYSKYYFESQIDYSERETRLISIYNYIECLIYDIKKTKKYLETKNCYNKFIRFINNNIFIYHILEIINMIIFFIENILLTIYYKKARNENDEKYNEIDNRNNFISINIIRIIHMVIIFIIILHWIIFRYKIDFFYSLTKYTNENFKESEKLKMSEKAKYLKKINIDTDNFFPKKRKEKIKYFNDDCIESLKEFLKKIFAYIANIRIYIFSLGTIIPFLISFICLCFSFLSQICFMIPLLLIFNLSESLRGIFLSIIFNSQSHTLILLIIYILLILYIFSWISFFFLPKMFKYEAVDNNNELVNQNYIEENICSSSVPCILYFMNFGLSSEGAIDMNLISFKNNTSHYLIQFFFDIFLYVFIHMIFFNVVLAMIGSAFDKMIEKVDKKDEDERNVCFICDKTRNDSISEHEDFDEHLSRHNKWKYIIYISNIILKNKEEYTKEEYYVWRQIRHKKIDWFPKYSKSEQTKD